MKKEDLLEHLRIAKLAHIAWIEKAKRLIKGFDIQENAIPVDVKECTFGKWFYSEGQALNALSNNPPECMNKIEMLHIEFHDKYLDIFNIYFPQEAKKGFFAKLLTKKRKALSAAKKELVLDYYKKMEKISQELTDEISRLERRLVAVSSEKIESLY